MSKKDQMLKKFYRNKVDSAYYELLDMIKTRMQKSDKSTWYYYRGSASESDAIVEKLKKDGFEVSVTHHTGTNSLEHRIDIRWLD